MLKNILNLEGTQQLTKTEQKSIKGARGSKICCEWCSDGTCADWVDFGATCPFTTGCQA